MVLWVGVKFDRLPAAVRRASDINSGWMGSHGRLQDNCDTHRMWNIVLLALHVN